jgi:hypothetical protein
MIILSAMIILKVTFERILKDFFFHIVGSYFEPSDVYCNSKDSK